MSTRQIHLQAHTLLVADTQHQVAASRHALHAGQRQRKIAIQITHDDYYFD